MKSQLKEANALLRKGDYQKAADRYRAIAIEGAAMKRIVDFNLNYCIAKLKKTPLSSQYKSKKIIVYTVLVGDYESVKEPEVLDPAARYLLFTDNPHLKSERWDVVVFDTLGLSPRRASRLPKLLPHRYLPEHDISVYIDASLTIKAVDVVGMANNTLGEDDIAAYKHFQRDCIYDEIQECLKLKKAEEAEVTPFLKRLKLEAFPQSLGLVENAFIVRRNNSRIWKLNQAWHDLFETYAARDQFYLMYIAWKEGVAIRRIEDAPQFRMSPHVNFTKHDWTRHVASVLHKPTINWIMNSDNYGWAYGNNATLLSAHLPDFNHVIDQHQGLTSIALYFDIKLFRMHGVLARRNILRVGGPRPIYLTYGVDIDALRQDLRVFDAIIVLNNKLEEIFRPLHPNVVLVPNALDLREWSPSTGYLKRRRGKSFTAGFAGNLKTRKEREIKGYDLLVEACAQIDVPLLHFGKGENQIPRNEMRERFFSAIDCLVHPVGEGKEGCSNIIMEALAMGVPVITTRHAGFHAERIKDGDGLIYCDRDVGDIARSISRLRSDSEFCARMSTKGRAFAEQHHDIRWTAPLYHRVFAGSSVANAPIVSFIPFWEPAHEFASSRLRTEQPVALLRGSACVQPMLGWSDSADIIVVSQLASDATYQRLQDNPDKRLIFDVCDRYFADEREVSGVQAKARFFELAQRAEVITVSTINLKREIAMLGLKKPVVYLPDGIDYREYRNARPSVLEGPVVWYGNPGRNNFESARWMIDHVMQKTRRDIRLISRKRTFKHKAKTEGDQFAVYNDICIDWNYDSFVSELSKCSICLLAHSAEERSKSPNRLVTAIANGVPVIVSGSPSCSALLRAGGLDYAIVETAQQLDHALQRLADPNERECYLARMQPLIESRFGDHAITARYTELFDRCISLRQSTVQDRSVGRCSTAVRTLFVTHNLNVGEGAPTSLMETVIGLADTGHVKPVVFSIKQGDLSANYARHGILVIAPDFGVQARLATKVMACARSKIEAVFSDLVRDHAINVVVLNTATTLWLAPLAQAMGIPVLGIIRESSDEHVAFNFGPNDLMADNRTGLHQLQRTIFVSSHTRDIWQATHHLTDPVVIPNGINLAPLVEVQALDKQALRTELGLPADRLILLSVGSINARKSQADIIEAFAILPPTLRVRCHLALVGAKPSPYLDALRVRIAELGNDIATRVDIIPETDKIAKWYRAADLFVFASRNESYPRVVVEAMLFGLPIISSAVFGTKEQIVNNESGLLFEPGNIKELSIALKKLIADQALRKRLTDGAAVQFWSLKTFWEMVWEYCVAILKTRNNYERLL